MNRKSTASLRFAGIFAVAALCAGAAQAQSLASNDANGATADAGLAAESIVEGKTLHAIAILEAELEKHPGDPALLINLGIAQAQDGDDAAARANFEAALASREVVELATADGRATDSRRLARRALAMLDRGAFRAQTRNDQISLRD